MAVVKDPLHSGAAAGVVGANVYRQRGGVSIVQAKSLYVPIETPARAVIRAIAAGINDEWKFLTDAQRALWNDYAATHPAEDRWGREQTISGFNWFYRLNMTARRYDQPYISEPLDGAPGNLYRIIQWEWNGPDINLRFLPYAADPAGTCYVEAWSAVSSTQTRSLRLSAAVYRCSRALPQTPPANYLLYEAPAAGKHFIWTRAVCTDTGHVGLWQPFTLTV